MMIDNLHIRHVLEDGLLGKDMFFSTKSKNCLSIKEVFKKQPVQKRDWMSLFLHINNLQGSSQFRPMLIPVRSGNLGQKKNNNMR